MNLQHVHVGQIANRPWFWQVGNPPHLDGPFTAKEAQVLGEVGRVDRRKVSFAQCNALKVSPHSTFGGAEASR